MAGRTFMYFQKIRDPQVFALAPPAIQGLGSSGGFEMVLLDNGVQGSEAPNNASNTLADLAGQTTEVTNVRGNAGELETRLKLSIDQERAGALGVDLSGANALLGIALAGSTVNDFDLNGELKPVMVKGDAEFGMQPDDLKTWCARNNSGETVPFSGLTKAERRRNITLPPWRATRERRPQLFPIAFRLAWLGGEAVPHRLDRTTERRPRACQESVPPAASHQPL